MSIRPLRRCGSRLDKAAVRFSIDSSRLNGLAIELVLQQYARSALRYLRSRLPARSHAMAGYTGRVDGRVALTRILWARPCAQVRTRDDPTGVNGGRSLVELLAQLLASGLAEGLQAGHGNEICPAYSECLEFGAVDASLDPLVYGLTGHRRLDALPGFFDAQVLLRVAIAGPSSPCGTTRAKACERFS